MVQCLIVVELYLDSIDNGFLKRSTYSEVYFTDYVCVECECAVRHLVSDYCKFFIDAAMRISSTYTLIFKVAVLDLLLIRSS